MTTLKDRLYCIVKEHEATLLDGGEPQTSDELLENIMEAIRQTFDRFIG